MTFSRNSQQFRGARFVPLEALPGTFFFAIHPFIYVD